MTEETVYPYHEIFQNLVSESFDYLKNELGFRKRILKKTWPFTDTVIYHNEVHGIEISVDTRDGVLMLSVMKLVNGRLTVNYDYNTPIDCLIKMIEPEYEFQHTNDMSAESIKRWLTGYSRYLKKYKQEILDPDFSLFNRSIEDLHNKHGYASQANILADELTYMNDDEFDL